MPVGNLSSKVLTIVPKLVYNNFINPTQVETSFTIVCEVLMEGFKEKVKALRQKRGWSQEDLARETGVSLSTVQRWERKGGKPIHLARRALERLFKKAGIECARE